MTDVQWQYNEQAFNTPWPPWHQQAAHRLLAQYRQGKLHTGLIFKGAQGLGKRAFAKRLVASLLCDQFKQANDLASSDALPSPCGECASCHLLQAGTHPDLHLLSLEEGKKTIAVDQVRLLIDVIQKTSQISHNRVAVLFPAEKLNENAANALLKLLEEPPQNSYLILVSDNADRLLPTIRSRCYVESFGLVERSAGVAYLSELSQVEQSQVETIWDKHRGFAQYAQDELAEGAKQDDFSELTLAVINKQKPLEPLIKLIDKESLHDFLQKCLLLFSTSGQNKHRMYSSTQQSELYARTMQLARQIESNPLPQLVVRQYLLECQQILAKANS